MDGQHALEYARERYAYTEGDRQRTKNQQQVLMGIINEATNQVSLQSMLLLWMRWLILSLQQCQMKKFRI